MFTIISKFFFSKSSKLIFTSELSPSYGSYSSTINITGNFIQSSTGHYEVLVRGNPLGTGENMTHDLLAVSGSATLSGEINIYLDQRYENETFISH